MSVANGKFPITITDSSYDQTVLTASQTGYTQIYSNTSSGIKYNYDTKTLKVDKIDASQYFNLPAGDGGVVVEEYDYNSPSTQMLLTVDKNDLTDHITTSQTGIEYDYAKKSLKVNGNVDIKSINNIKYHNNNTYQDTHYKPFPEIVRAFYEFTTKNDFMYDYSGNGFNLTNNGAVFSEQGAYFPTNEGIQSKTNSQMTARKIELSGAPLTSLLNSIDADFSLSFDFNPSENNGCMFILSKDGSTDNSIVIKIAADGKLQTTYTNNSITVADILSSSAVSLNRQHHYCLVQTSSTISVYLDNVLVGTDTDVFDINDKGFTHLTIGQKRLFDGNYVNPYAGYISCLMITKESIGNTLRTAIYNNDYGYDIIILGGQSNMTGRAIIQPGIDNDYSEITGEVFQYDYVSSSIIAATNPLKTYPSPSDPGGTMGPWLEFVKNYIKYYKKSKCKKVLIVPNSKSGSSFLNDWGIGKTMITNLDNNMNAILTNSSNIVTPANKLCKVICMLWYQGEAEVWNSNANFPNQIELLRNFMILNVDGFTADTPMIVTTTNSHRDEDVVITINGQKGITFVNDTIRNFAASHNYGCVETSDLNNLPDWIHLDAPSLRKLGKRYFDKLCEITNIDNRSKSIIDTVDSISTDKLISKNVVVDNLTINYDSTYDIPNEKFDGLLKEVSVSIPSMRTTKWHFQPKTNTIWIMPSNADVLTFKTIDVSTGKLVDRTDLPTINQYGVGSVLYKDKLYIIDGKTNYATPNNTIEPLHKLTIIDTLTYQYEVIPNLVTKTSGIITGWTAPANSSSNVTIGALGSVAYSAAFGYNDKIYFIPYNQQEIAIYNIKTKTFDQTSYALGYVGGFYGCVWNPTNKCLYMSRAYKVGANAGYNIPYLNFNNSTPTLSAVTLPTNYLSFKWGTFCFSNNAVYMSMGQDNNGANAYILKINSNHSTESITLGGAVESKVIGSSFYTRNDKLLFLDAPNSTLYTVDPATNAYTTTTLTTGSSLVLQCGDKDGNVYICPTTNTVLYGRIKYPITMQNRELLMPVFNNQN